MRRNETLRRTFLVFACINALSKKILRTALHAGKNISLFVKNIRHIFQITSHIFQNICLVFSGFCHVLISMKLQKRFSSLSAQMPRRKNSCVSHISPHFFRSVRHMFHTIPHKWHFLRSKRTKLLPKWYKKTFTNIKFAAFRNICIISRYFCTPIFQILFCTKYVMR